MAVRVRLFDISEVELDDIDLLLGADIGTGGLETESEDYRKDRLASIFEIAIFISHS